MYVDDDKHMVFKVTLGKLEHKGKMIVTIDSIVVGTPYRGKGICHKVFKEILEVTHGINIGVINIVSNTLCNVCTKLGMTEEKIDIDNEDINKPWSHYERECTNMVRWYNE